MTPDTATPPVATETAKEVKPRQPKLSLTVNGATHNLLKYPFPVKSATFAVMINDEPAVASCTAGRGKAYTYILYKNTSFYIPGTLPVDAVCVVTFPEGYKFDDAKQVRVSNYKPKKKAAKAGEPVAAADPAADAGTVVAPAAPAAEPTPVVAESSSQQKTMEAQGAKATRRGR